MEAYTWSNKGDNGDFLDEINGEEKSIPPSIGGSGSIEIVESLPMWRRLTYAAGGIPMQLTQNIISFFLPLFLLETSKLMPFYLSAIQFIGRLSDALTDPVVGYLVLRTDTRFGRNRPWLLISAPISAVAFFFVFFTVNFHSDVGRFIFYLCAIVILQIAITCFHVPYSSMVMVLTDAPKERDTLTAYRMFSEIISILLGVAVFGLIVSPYRVANSYMDVSDGNTTASTAEQLNSTNATAFQLEKNAYMIAAATTSLIVIVTSLICYLGTQERKNFDDPLTGYFRALRKILTFRPYILLMGSFLCLSLGIQFVQGNLSLYITHSLKMSKYTIPGIMTVLASAIIFLPVAQLLVRRIGKKKTMAAGILHIIPLLVSCWFIPAHLSLWIFFPLMAWPGFTISIAFLLPWSMLPDVIDAFSLEHNMRHEAVFYSLYVFFNKFAVGISLAISAAILGFVGYDIEKYSQPEKVGLALRYLCSPCGILFFLPSLVLLYFYPLDNSKLADIRTRILLRSNTSTIDILLSHTSEKKIDDWPADTIL